VIARDRVIEKSLQSVSHQVEECGYAIIPDVLSSEEVKRLASDLQSQQLPRSRAGVRHMLSVPCVAQIAHDLRLLGLAQKILGRDAFPFRTTLFDKAPDSKLANHLASRHSPSVNAKARDARMGAMVGKTKCNVRARTRRVIGTGDCSSPSSR
jgi:hypothetical protein